MKTNEEILKAAAVLRLSRSVSILQLKRRYRALAKAHHPDRQEGTHDPEIVQINEAYATLMHYFQHYEIPLDAEKPLEDPRSWWKEQFGDGF